MFDTRRVNANSITAIAGSMTSGIKAIRPAISLEQQARMAGRTLKRPCSKGYGSGMGSSCGCSGRKSFYIVKS